MGFFLPSRPFHAPSMQNDEGNIVDLYIPRKCSATNRLITAKDHASVQIEIAECDEEGKMTGKNDFIALAGFMRQRGEADACLNRLFADRDLLASESEVLNFGRDSPDVRATRT